MRFLVALVASLAFASASTHHAKSTPYTEKELEGMFTQYIKTHAKKYSHDDFFNRFHAFKSNMEAIRVHNQSGASYTLGANAFADLTQAEYKAAKLGYKNIDQGLLRQRNEVTLDDSDLAASVDWRSSGAVTPVKDQGQCGSCWAFSTTGSTESAVFLKTGKLTSLSEQELVDCSTTQGNQGCNGGLMDYGFQYIISNKGIATESSYPYKGVDGTCQKKPKSGSTITSFKDVPAGNESQLLAAVAKQPVSIAIEADQLAFQLYSGGVFTAACGTNLDHGVLAVGYGTDAGKDYWIVKNSWGATWGEQGYIRLVRGKNQCGLANSASYPVA